MSTNLTPCELATGEPRLYDDPVAEHVAGAIRESQGQLTWYPLQPPPQPAEWCLPVADGQQITLNFLHQATFAVAVPCSDDIDEAKREAPAAILAMLDRAVLNLQRILNQPMNGASEAAMGRQELSKATDEPTVGERLANLDDAIGSIETAEWLVEKSGRDLPSRSQCKTALMCAREAIDMLRGELP